MGELPRIWMVVVIGFVSIIFAIVWLITYDLLNSAIWQNNFVSSNNWVLPIGVLFFSLLVGLGQKYLNAPNVIKGSTVDSIKGGESVSYKRFPGTLLSSFMLLAFGRGRRPGGPLGFLVQEMTGWIEDKLKVPEGSRTGFMTAALASAFNGIIGTPLFTAVLATEVAGPKKDRLVFLGWNLLAGVIGYFIFTLSGLHSFLGAVPFPPLQTQDRIFIIYAIILGAIGALIVVFLSIAFKFFGKFMARFNEKSGYSCACRRCHHRRGRLLRTRCCFFRGNPDPLDRWHRRHVRYRHAPAVRRAKARSSWPWRSRAASWEARPFPSCSPAR